MHKSIFVLFLSLITSLSMASSFPILVNGVKQHGSHLSNPVTRHFSRLKSDMNLLSDEKRTINFPTHVVRLDSPISNSSLNCDEVMDKIEEIFLKKITDYDISFSLSWGCHTMDEKAVSFRVYGYFDPLTDVAITYLKNHMATYDGTDLYGVPLKFEAARGLVTILNVDPVFIKRSKESNRYHFENTLYFDTAYHMASTLENDIGNKLLTNNPELITSFIKQWMNMKYESQVYDFLDILKESNAVHFWNDIIFLLDIAPKAYSIPTVFFTNDCSRFPNKRCL